MAVEVALPAVLVKWQARSARGGAEEPVDHAAGAVGGSHLERRPLGPEVNVKDPRST